MPDLPHLSGKEGIRILVKLGFFQARQRGSHAVMKKQTSEGFIGCVVPLHDKVAIGTLHSILKQAKISQDEFVRAARER